MARQRWEPQKDSALQRHHRQQMQVWQFRKLRPTPTVHLAASWQQTKQKSHLLTTMEMH